METINSMIDKLPEQAREYFSNLPAATGQKIEWIIQRTLIDTWAQRRACEQVWGLSQLPKLQYAQSPFAYVHGEDKSEEEVAELLLQAHVQTQEIERVRVLNDKARYGLANEEELSWLEQRGYNFG